ncbi:hypothetical protein OROMI_010471 [Orobanche minor]
MLVYSAPPSLRPINGNSTLSSQSPSHFIASSSPFLKWRFRDQDGSVGTTGIKNHAFRILANTDVAGRRDAKGEVIMVDPLEAKRLAAKQMRDIKAREKLNTTSNRGNQRSLSNDRPHNRIDHRRSNWTECIGPAVWISVRYRATFVHIAPLGHSFAKLNIITDQKED